MIARQKLCNRFLFTHMVQIQTIFLKKLNFLSIFSPGKSSKLSVTYVFCKKFCYFFSSAQNTFIYGCAFLKVIFYYFPGPYSCKILDLNQKTRYYLNQKRKTNFNNYFSFYRVFSIRSVDTYRAFITPPV